MNGIDIRLGPLWGGADDDDLTQYYDNLYYTLGGFNDDFYKNLIKDTIVPYYQDLHIDVRRPLSKKLKDSLEDLKVNFEAIFDGVLPHFELTVNARQFLMDLSTNFRN